jgi:hypothetical protein
MTQETERGRRLVEEIGQSDERWQAFVANPAEMLRAQDVDLRAVHVKAFRLPEWIVELFPPTCPNGWEPRLVSESQCVCVQSAQAPLGQAQYSAPAVTIWRISSRAALT